MGRTLDHAHKGVRTLYVARAQKVVRKKEGRVEGKQEAEEPFKSSGCPEGLRPLK